MKSLDTIHEGLTDIGLVSRARAEPWHISTHKEMTKQTKHERMGLWPFPKRTKCTSTDCARK